MSAPSSAPDTGGTDILLIAGLWLRESVWDGVVAGLRERGHRPVAVALPGAGAAPDPAVTLQDQVDAVLSAVDAAERPLVVGHSAASTLAWLAADARPDAVARVAFIGGMPTTPGEQYAAFFPLVDGLMPFPGWEPFAGPDSDDLDEATRAGVAADTVAVPGGVATAVVTPTDERRYAVPVTMICPEFSPDDARAWVAAGDIPELVPAHELDYVDIDSGHWPMVSRVDDLVAILDELARRTA